MVLASKSVRAEYNGAKADADHSSHETSAMDAVAGSFDSRSILVMARTSAVLVIVSQVTIALASVLLHPWLTREALPLYALNILVAIALGVLTLTRWMLGHWRCVTWAACAYLLASIAAIATIEQEPGFFYTAALIVILGSGAVMPWSVAWQDALNLFAILVTAIYWRWSGISDQSLHHHWAGVLTAVCVAHFAAVLGRRYRAELALEFDALGCVQDPLREGLEQAERKLRESERTLREIFDASADGIVVIDLETNTYLDVSAEFVRASGYSREELLGRTPEEANRFVHPEQLEELRRQLKKYGRVRNFALDLRSKDGTIRPYIVSAVTASIGDRPCMVVLERDITEREDAERKVHESERTLREIFDASADGIVVIDLETNTYLDVSAEFVRASGYSREELLGRTPEEANRFVHPEQLEEFHRQLKKQGRIRNFALDLRSKDGTIRPYIVSVVTASIGGRPCTVMLERDITEREEAERKIRESEATLRRILDSAVDPMSVNVLADGTYLYVNRAFVAMHGVKQEEALGKNVRELGTWPDVAKHVEYVQRLCAEGTVRGLETYMRTADGGINAVLVSGAVVEIDGRQCVISNIRDISEHKEAERRIEESRAALRTTFDSLLDPLAIIDMADGRYIDVNDEFLRVTGYRRNEVIGKASRDIGLWPSQCVQQEFMRRLDAAGEVRNLQMKFDLGGGAERTLLLSGILLKLSGRRCVLTIARDISQLKETQRELEAAREAALAASKAKSEFLSSMSHEIRTPMTAILGMADLLSETELGGEQRRYLDTIISNGDTLLALINDILDLARVESGRLCLEAAEFDLVDLAEKVGDALAVRACEKRLELMVRFAPDVPGALIGDSLRLRQVLTNLVANAIKFTEQGEVVLTVTRDPNGTTAGSLLFSVADTGIGISKDKLAAIFSAFTQADSSVTRKYGGSGLGLAIVERLVTLMGGRVWVESEPGKGSTFYVAAQFDVPAVPAVVQPVHEVNLDGMRMLVVDDNATNRLILREMLTAVGAVVSESASGPDGLQAIDEARHAGRPFQLLIVDCRMPGMDGFEMAKRLRQGPAANDLVIMMLSSSEAGGRISALKAAGLDHFLVKPIKRRELYATIAEAMAGAAGPTSAGEALSDASKPARALRPAAPVLNRALKILVADDSSDNRLIIQAYLKKTPYVLDEAENGQIAVEKFIAGHYDLVLMDIQMPVLDGYTAMRTIRQWEQENQRPRTPIIALTASALEDAVRRATEAGCDLHVSKPFKKAALLEAIARTAGGEHVTQPANGEARWSA